MRKYFRIALFAFTLVLSGISCQKELSSSEDQHDVFNEIAAKEWYYGTFKKSAEWATSNLKGKKLPDWKHPVVGKLGNYDIVEFPLVSKTTSYPVYSNQANKNLTTAEITRIASAAVSKIVFFKNGGQIFVREINFIPEWEYLKANNYDVSDISILNKQKDFSGNIVVKKWDGSLLSSGIYSNGKQTMKSKLVRVGNDGKNGEVNSIETLVCTDYQFCVWQQDCEIVINGDQMTTICEEWYNTGDCWIETYCEDDGEDCVLTGTCGDPGGGGGSESGPVTRQMTFTVAASTHGFWSVASVVEINGFKDPQEEPFGGHFTGISHLGAGIVNNPGSPYIATFQLLGATTSLVNNYAVQCTTTGIVRYSNNEITDETDPNGDKYISRTKSWTYSEVF